MVVSNVFSIYFLPSIIMFDFLVICYIRTFVLALHRTKSSIASSWQVERMVLWGSEILGEYCNN